MNREEEKELVKRAQEGDVKAFERLVLAYQKKIFTTAYWFIGNSSDAGDITQDVFVNAFVKIGSFRGDSSFYTWLNWLLIDYSSRRFRKKKIEKKIISTDETIHPGETEKRLKELAHSEDTPLSNLLSQERQQLVLEAIHALKDVYRIPLILCDIERCSYAEAAQIMKCGQGTVKSRLFRARMLLRKQLSKVM